MINLMPNNNQKGVIPVVLLIIIAVLVLGFIIGRYANSSLPFSKVPKFAPSTVKEDSPIVKNQSATIIGNVTKFENSKITIVDEQGKEDTFSIASNLVIYKPTSDNQSKASTNQSDIEVNRKAFAILKFEDNEYRVASISYASTSQ